MILVDNSNIFIEGQKYSARRKGVIKEYLDERDICDPSWRIDFGKLLGTLAGGRQVHDAILVGSRPPKADTVWESAKHKGFRVTVHDRDSQNKEKAVDTELVAQGTEIICSCNDAKVLIIASGDRDFLPLVNVAHRKNWYVEMWAFTSSFRAAGAMASSVDKVRPLDKVFEEIGVYEFEWPIQES